MFEPVRGRAADYDASYYRAIGQSEDRPALRWYVRMVRRYLGSGPYLDFGCGTGHLLRRLSEHGAAVGYEISGYAAELSRRVAPRATVHTVTENIPSETFRAVTAIHILEHLDDDTVREVAACWRRVLTPCGRVLVVVPDPGGRGRALAGPGWIGFRDPTHINLKTHAEWRAFLVAAGFTVEREGSDGLWNVPYGRLPKFLDAVRYTVPSLTQFLAGRLFLPPGSGESSVFVLRARAAG